MTDSHVHVGWYVDRYHAPDVVTVALRDAGIDTIAVSSTSTCADEYEFVISEMMWLQEEWGTNIFPLFWITPKMLESGAIDQMLNSGIHWRGVKMHWQANPDFYYSASLLDDVMNNSRLDSLPMLLHTGGFPECHASVFDDLLGNYPSRTFILAHGRPLDETVELLGKHSNAYVDTAFMEIPDIVSLVHKGFAEKILWGSDCPINEHFYPALSSEEYLKSRLLELRRCVPDVAFREITETNYNSIFFKTKT